MATEVSKNGKIVTKLTFQGRSQAAEELISKKPGPLIQYGSSIFMVVLVLLVIACWLVKYPDHIPAKAKLTSVNAPKKVICRAEGKLIKLYVKEGDAVEKGTLIGFLESTADQSSVIMLSRMMDSIAIFLAADKPDSISRYFQHPFPKLGELQQAYQDFTQAYHTFRNYTSNGIYLRKKQLLLTDLEYQKLLQNNLAHQRTLIKQDVSISGKSFEMNRSLRNDKVISENAYRDEESKFLSKVMSEPRIEEAILLNDMQQNEKLNQIMEIDNQINQQRRAFTQSVNTFKSKIEEWEMKFLLTAPISGVVAFSTFLQENQQLQVNQTLCYINPRNSEYYAELLIPQPRSGKARIGQMVKLKFEAYPDVEFGQVTGRIDFITQIPSDSGYLAKVSLPNGLITTYNKKIQYHEGLVANGEIITEDMRLLERLYYNLYAKTQN